MPKERLRASAAVSAVTGGRLLKCFPPDFSQHGVASPLAAAASAAAGNPVYVLATEEDTLMMMEPGMDTASSPAGECSIDNQTNLIVNYLPQTMTQDDIRTLFASLGELESCKLVRDKTTGQSLGYGFVKYSSPISAQNAINAFNGLRLQNKTIKVSLARPSSDTIKGANLYISGLSKNFTSHELNSLFAPYGNIISTRVLCDPLTGLSKGVGFIRFNLRTEAEAAIKELNGTTPPGAGSKEPITVKFASQPTTIVTKPVLSSSLQLPQQQQQQLNIATASMLQPQIPTASHVGLAPHLIQVHPYFQPLNRIRYASLDGVYPSTIQPMTTPNTAVPTASSASAGTWTLFVYNLPPDVEDNVIWRLFGPYGAVQSVKVMRDAATQKCKGYGFVTMTNYEEAALAISGVNGHQLDNHILQVSFKRTQQQVQPVVTSVASAAGTPLNGCTLPSMIPFGLASGISQGQAPPNFLNQATLIQNLGFPGFTNQGFPGIANPGFAGLAGAGFPAQAAIPISIL